MTYMYEVERKERQMITLEHLSLAFIEKKKKKVIDDQRGLEIDYFKQMIKVRKRGQII